MPLLLTSASWASLNPWLDDLGVDGPVTVVTSASRELGDRGDIIEPALAAIRAGGRAATAIDLFAQPAAALHGADAVVMTGGDPFALLTALRTSGGDRWLRDAHRRGLPIAGQSAGAMVCGPSLAPLRITSPFAAPEGLDLSGLALTDRLVLPHHDRPGRADKHHQAAAQFASSVRLMPLWDDETLLLDDDAWQIVRGDQRTRAAEAADAAAVAAVYQAAAGKAWAPFLGADRLARQRPDDDRWAARIAAAGSRFLVTEDAAGTSGFVQYGPASDPDLLPGTGEVDLLYTHPRAWGQGCGRRLLDRAVWELRQAGCSAAVLWTEHRNERALAVYRANGWQLDGAERQRDYLGVTIRELRHRRELTA
jgi:peptidase E/ribosomal protein S18 acetylase RimI-like enzyme